MQPFHSISLVGRLWTQLPVTSTASLVVMHWPVVCVDSTASLVVMHWPVVCVDSTVSLVVMHWPVVCVDSRMGRQAKAVWEWLLCRGGVRMATLQRRCENGYLEAVWEWLLRQQRQCENGYLDSRGGGWGLVGGPRWRNVPSHLCHLRVFLSHRHGCTWYRWLTGTGVLGTGDLQAREMSRRTLVRWLGGSLNM